MQSVNMKNICILYWCLVHLLVVASGKSCSQPNSLCSTNKQCCSIPNGKSYCNVQTKRCEASRYCLKTWSSNECPFNDLSAEELKNVMKIIGKSKVFSSEIRFLIVRKQEPKKKLWNCGYSSAKERIAYAAVQDMDRNLLSEVLVSLQYQKIISVNPRKDSVGTMGLDEIEIAKEIFLNDLRVKQAYKRRGLNESYAESDVWAFRALGNGKVNGTRIVKSVPFYMDPHTKYMSWTPVEDLVVTIDIDKKKIVDFIDHGNTTVPKAPCIAETDDSTIPHSKSVPASSIQISGYQVEWHNWKFQYSMDPVHGLQLYHIRYTADGRERFLIYKYSISEMFVPYGADGDGWNWRGAFDAGEYGLGRAADTLVLGKDVPPNAILLTCTQFNDRTGEVTELKGCIAIYEQNVYPLYKYRRDGRAGTNLVVAFNCVVGNYNYLFDVMFSMDGNIEVHVRSTGIIHIRGVAREINDINCIEDCLDYVNEHAVAPEHQHFYNYRIDFDIDGANNVMIENDYVNDPKSERNPYGGAFSLRRTIIRNETYRDNSPENSRFWSVINPQSRNRFNTPRGYSISPLNIASPFWKRPPLNQALFIEHPIWVTVYDDSEQGAAGMFPRSGIPYQGLPTFVQNKQSLLNADLVVWHTFALTHGPRPEEYPFLNSMTTGFRMLSRNFQSSNPNVMQCEREAKRPM